MLLFDGTDTSLWRGTVNQSFPASSWKVEDGALRARLDTDLSNFEDLVTKQTFRDFELTFDVLLSPNANTGVKYLVQETRVFGGHRAAIGFELQMIDDNGHPDARRGPIRRSGALYSLIPPAQPASRPIGEWNHGRILLRGKAVEHWLNGHKVVDYRLDNQELHASLKTVGGTLQYMAGWSKWDTPLSLQHHCGDIRFRNLKARRLE